MSEDRGPFLEPEDEDPSDDEEEADKDPVTICNHCGSAECKGDCYSVLGYGAI